MKYLYILPSDETKTSCLAILKRGTFSSAKQFRYFRDVLSTNEPAFGLFGVTPPEGAEILIFVNEVFSGTNGKNFGKKSRRRERFVWANSGGVIRVDTLKIKYDDKNGSSCVDRVEVGEQTPRIPDPEVETLDLEQAERQKAIETKRAASQYIGDIGERREFRLTLRFKTSFVTQYGYSTVFVFDDEMGNAVKYMGSADLNVGRGETVSIVATIKAHDEYKGEKQTSILRPKVKDSA